MLFLTMKFVSEIVKVRHPYTEVVELGAVLDIQLSANLYMMTFPIIIVIGFFSSPLS